MTTFTNVPDTNLEPGDPIRSVDIIAIKDNTLYLHDKLNAINVQTFNSNGTWTKPTVNGTIVGRVARIQVWGGGGGGGAWSLNNSAGGGGGGGYNEIWKNITDLGATETVTVGAGGNGVVGNATAGSGGTSSFGSHCSAYGGGGGRFNGGGGGGGQLSAGGTTSGLIQSENGNPNVSNFWEGGAGALTEDSSPVNLKAKNSVFGGAGGGSNSLSFSQGGGISVHGGNGGAIGGNGTAPGGGGGANRNDTVGNGAAGRVVITVF